MGHARVGLLASVLLLLTGCAGSGGERPLQQQEEPVTTPAESALKSEAPAPLSEEQLEALGPLVELMRVGEWLAAREMAQELIMTQPMLAEAYANMGAIQLQLKEPEKAAEMWRKALQLRPGWAAVHNRLGMLYRSQGRFDEALEMYRLALKADEDYADAHRNIAILYELYRGELEAALQHYKRYQQLLGGEEREVEMWIVDLERRIKRAAR